jgi:hypothetical protein
MHATHYQIRRSGYIPKAGKMDYNRNMFLDGYLFWNMYENLSVYAHGTASLRYLLGDVPLIYNTRSNHRFNNPYGFASLGMAYQF